MAEPPVSPASLMPSKASPAANTPLGRTASTPGSTATLAERPSQSISKAKAKKDAKKEAKRDAKKAHAEDKSPDSITASKAPAPKATTASQTSLGDSSSMFKVGFLAGVYTERPTGSAAIEKVVTRFPPEPNGYLHIGHSKAIAINFGFAKYHGGECYLRLDDTNPAGERKEYDDSIEEMIGWLGFTPKKITHSSDNFERLYSLAEELVQKGKAYVCHCTKSEIVDQRGGGEGKKPRYGCKHRDRPSYESLTEFRAMRDGKYGPNEAALRMKQSLPDGNPQMWDLVAYRIPQKKGKQDKEAEGIPSSKDIGLKEGGEDGEEAEEEQYTGHHYRTGDKWIIYPTYDFAHCLCDSFEGITHSLCTTEFEMSRVSYEWLNKELGVYEPMQREYGRLGVSGTVLSKRKITKLVNEGYVRSWDDPRLYTLPALRRRGVPPGAILSFVNELGVTKATTVIEIQRFESSVRKYLEATVPRLMLVLDPVKVVIDELPDAHLDLLEMPFSKDPAYGSHKVPFTKTLYIERGDFLEADRADYFRLAPGKTVGLLKVPFPITAKSFEKDPETGLVTIIHATYEKPAEGGVPIKPRSWIHWVASSAIHQSPIKANVRVINSLFKSSNPSAHPEGFLSDINPNSEENFPNAMIETGLKEIRSRAPWPLEAGEKQTNVNLEHAHQKDGTNEAPRPETTRFQGMRVGYFCIDQDTKGDHIVLNRIVTLKEDAGK